MKARKLALWLVWMCIAVSAQKAVPPHEDQWLLRPVDDRTYHTYLDFFRYDENVPWEVRVLDTTEDQGIAREHLSFQSTPGVRVTTNIFRPSSDATALPVIVLLHGGGGQGKENPGVVRTASILARAGYIVDCIDLLYFGERASSDMFVSFTDREKHEKLYNQPSAYLTWLTQSVKDTRRSLDFVLQQRHGDSNRIAIIGMSRGAIVGTVVGAVDTRFAGVVLFYGGHFDALETGHLPAACPANYITHISPRPILMINGTRDSDMLKDSSVDPLYRLAKQPKQILWSDSGHVNPNEEQRTAMLQWLREKLK